MVQAKESAAAVKIRQVSKRSAPRPNHFVMNGTLDGKKFKIIYDSTSFTGVRKYGEGEREGIAVEESKNIGQLLTVFESKSSWLTVLIPKYVDKSFNSVVIFTHFGGPGVAVSAVNATAEVIIY